MMSDPFRRPPGRSDADRRALANRVRWARFERGLTQHQLAVRARISLPTVSRVETARRWPANLVAQALARALHVREAWLLDGIGEPAPDLPPPPPIAP